MMRSVWNASSPVARRTFLRAGGLSTLGLSMPQLFAARADAAPKSGEARPAAPAKACILLYMLGGPPQQETFDLKPEAPGSARSLFKPIATNVPGIDICELLPDLARQADRFAIVRSVFHAGNALFHGAGVHYNLTGWPNFPREGEPFLDRRDHPSIGAVLNQLQPTRNGLPPSMYGDDRLGRSCLVARRLVEAGVSLVTVIFGGWDTHSHHLEHTRDRLLPPLNRAFAALLADLADRGLLDSTMVAWTGEFGRTPIINGNNPPGRDHWGRVYSTVLAGGGIQGGQVYGKSDNLAGDPIDNPVPVSDFVATIYHALGYDTDTQVVDALGRPQHIVAGRPLLNLF